MVRKFRYEERQNGTDLDYVLCRIRCNDGLSMGHVKDIVLSYTHVSQFREIYSLPPISCQFSNGQV